MLELERKNWTCMRSEVGNNKHTGALTDWIASPFAGKTDMQILMFIFQEMRPHRGAEPPLKDKVWELIKRCWAREASDRPG